MSRTTTAKGYQQLSLRESAAFDYRTGQRDKLTGWGQVSADRAKRGVSRKARRTRKAGA